MSGICPFCKEEVNPTLHVENTFRRNIFKCPKCGKQILKCRNPLCNDYTRAGERWDDELCPDCTMRIPGVITTVFVNTLPFIMRWRKK
jgi:hypothetical protein